MHTNMKPLWDHMTGQTNQALTAEDRMDSDFVIHLLWCIHLFYKQFKQYWHQYFSFKQLKYLIWTLSHEAALNMW